MRRAGLVSALNALAMQSIERHIDVHRSTSAVVVGDHQGRPYDRYVAMTTIDSYV